jgi:hypothetical protein
MCSAWVYLVGVLGVSTVWGFGLSARTAVASAVALDHFRNAQAVLSWCAV